MRRETHNRISQNINIYIHVYSFKGNTQEQVIIGSLLTKHKMSTKSEKNSKIQQVCASWAWFK